MDALLVGFLHMARTFVRFSARVKRRARRQTTHWLFLCGLRERKERDARRQSEGPLRRAEGQLRQIQKMDAIGSLAGASLTTSTISFQSS
jgi:hypothetical protein